MLSQKQKLELYKRIKDPDIPETVREMMKRKYGGISITLSDLLFILNDIDFIEISDGTLKSINDRIEKLETKKVEAKNGYTPKVGIDFFTAQEINEIARVIYEKAKPRKGEDYMTEEDMENLCQRTLGKIELPEGKDGITPVAGKDYPTMEQTKKMLLDLFNNKDSNDSNFTEFEKKIIDLITKTYPKVDISAEKIVSEINLLPLTPDKQIDWVHIKNAPKRLLKEKKTGRIGGGGDIMMIEDLSSQTDGSTKTFTVPYSRKAIKVEMSDGPVIHLYENNGFSLNTARTQMTLADAVKAPTEGSQLGYIYIL